MMFLELGSTGTVKLGPFVDSGDGDTDEPGLTASIKKANVLLSKNGGALTAANADQGVANAGAPYDANGYYNIALNETDRNTLGRLKVDIHVAGALHVWADFMVIPATAYDALVTAGSMSTFDPATDKVFLGDGAHGGVNTVVTLKNMVVNNPDGVGIDITGLTDGISTYGGNHGMTASGVNVGIYASGIYGFHADGTTYDFVGNIHGVIDAATNVTDLSDIKGATWNAGTDTLEHIRDAVTAAAPANHAATANVETAGTLNAGTFADTATDDDLTYYDTSPNGVGLDVSLTFGIGTGRVPSSVLVDGHFASGAQRTVQVWAYHYLLGEYVQLSNSATDFNNSGNDSSRQYPLTVNMVKVLDGEVSIRFTSTSTETGDHWMVDYVAVTSVQQASAGLTLGTISHAVWDYPKDGMIDEGTMGYVVGHISILQGQIVSATGASVFVLDAGASSDLAYIGMLIRLEDGTDEHYEVRQIIGYTALTKTVVVDRPLGFTPEAGDDYYIMSTGYVGVPTKAEWDTQEL